MPAKPPPRAGSPASRARPRRRRVLTGLAILLALALAGHGALWHWAGTRLEAGFAAWAAARRAEGWTVAHGPASRGGWPLRAALILPDLQVVAGRDATVAPAWRAETPVTLSIGAPQPDRLQLALAGQHLVRPGGEVGEAWRLDVRRFDMALPVTAPPTALPAWAEAEAETLRLALAAPGSEGWRLRRAALLLRSHPGAGRGESALTLQLHAEDLDLPPDTAPPKPFGRRIDGGEILLAVTGPVPPAAAPPAWQARSWRDGGGTLSLREATLRWGPAAARLDAALALDEALQPAGEGTLHLTGVSEVLAAATAAGLIPPRTAAAARMLLPLLQRTPPEGGPPRIEAPVRIDAGVLSLARIPLVRLAPFAW